MPGAGSNSLLKAGNNFIEALDRIPFYTYINIVLESADPVTLAHINKPLELNTIKAAFQKMLEINRRYLNIEITANFLLGDRFVSDHYDALIELIRSGLFSHGDRSLFSGLTGHLLNRDDYLVMADFEAYVDAQRQVSGVWGDPDQWTRMSVLNVSRIGYFSSDRSIAEYAEKIWKVEPTRIPNDLP